MKLPNYPDFKILELSDKDTIESFAGRFPTSSDYYFPGWWSWDTESKTLISQLNGNLVTKRVDYLKGTFFYSFLGTSKVEETASLLVDRARSEGISEELKLILGVTVERFQDKSDWNVVEDPENHDYLLLVEKICGMKGGNLHSKRRKVNRFIENYNATVTVVDSQDLTLQKDLLELWRRWSNITGKDNTETEQELRVFEKMFGAVQYFKVEALCVYVDGNLEGFVIFEDLKNGNVISSFEKGNTHFMGIYEFMKFKLAICLKSRGCKHINIEQDLGNEGLRSAKSGYAPEYLKKFRIRRKV